MTEKVQKIRDKVVWLMSNHDSALDYEAALEDVLNIIDSMQEEPESEDLEEAADNALSNVLNTHKIVNVRSCLEMFRLGAKWQKKKYDIIGNDLEEAAENYAQEAYSHPVDREVGKADFILGAKWQFERVNEALLSEVLPCFMHGGEADEVVAKLDEVLSQKK